MKICPDLTQIVWEKTMSKGHGDRQKTKFNRCIKEKCVAYESGMCRKYMTKAYEHEEEVK